MVDTPLPSSPQSNFVARAESARAGAELVDDLRGSTGDIHTNWLGLNSKSGQLLSAGRVRRLPKVPLFLLKYVFLQIAALGTVLQHCSLVRSAPPRRASLPR